MLEGGGGGGSTSGEKAGAGRFRSGGGGGKTSGGSVYFGRSAPSGYSSKLGEVQGERFLPRVDQYLSRPEAYNFINNLSGKQLADMQAKMQYAGMIQDNDGLLEMRTKWKKLVDASAAMTATGRKISPMDILDSYLGRGALGGKGGMGGAGGAPVWQTQYRGGRKFLVNSQTGEVKYEGPRFETTYNKTIDLTDPTTAKAIATSVFQQLLHRDPGNGELGGFSTALRTAEQQSPVVTNTTTEYDMNTGEPIGQTSKSSGGFSADAKQYLAQQRIKKGKEYGAVQAATTYENALEAAIFNNPFGSI